MTDALMLRGVTRHHRGRGKPVLDDVELQLGRGELVGLLGANGAGKSTLLAVAAGIRRSAGEVQSLGPVGWMGESGPLPRTVDGLLRLVVAARGRGAVEAIRERIPLADGPIDALSAGQRRLVGLAAAVVFAPAVLLLDEPLTHLDEAGMEVVHRIIAEECLRGVGVLVATHHASRFSFDRSLTLTDGRLV